MYYRTIPGSKTLAEILALIIAEEAGGSLFVENKVASLNPRPGRPGITNIVKFNEIDTAAPAAPTLIATGGAPPANATLQWKGAMLSAGSTVIAELYRPRAV